MKTKFFIALLFLIGCGGPVGPVLDHRACLKMRETKKCVCGFQVHGGTVYNEFHCRNAKEMKFMIIE